MPVVEDALVTMVPDMSRVESMENACVPKSNHNMGYSRTE